MLLKEIKIHNFRSISHLIFKVKKYGNSYTSMFVGINEVGKSSILQAMSFLETPAEEFNFLDLNNQNNDKEEYIDLFFKFEFENNRTYFDVLEKEIIESNAFLSLLNISNVTKNVYLKRGNSYFQETYSVEWEPFNLKDYYYFKSSTGDLKIKLSSGFTPDEFRVAKKLTEKELGNILVDLLVATIKKYESKVSFWKPEKEYLITDAINLQDFKNNPSTNIPLKNIFALSDYKTEEEIKTKIEEISENHTHRRGLESVLSDNASEYFGSVWEHEITIDIEISETLMCSVHVKDKGKANKNKFFNMNSRSQGFHQFASLILSLSIQNHSLEMKNRLILIDEPENHLHPSGVRDIMKELLRIGDSNYVFLATHSCFMIDKKTRQRNFIIKKDDAKNTIYQQINKDSEVIDDEVLRDAFGINVYKDFLSPHKLLVEGLSDKKIIEKILSKLKPKETILITNGHGSNIDSIASRLNFEDISPLVILDDDEEGRKYKDKIVRIGGNFTEKNVLTLRDLEANLIAGGTIEDLLGKSFVESTFREQYNSEFEKDPDAFSLDEKTPFLDQIKKYLYRNEKEANINKFLERFKIKISDELNPSDNALNNDFSLLKSFVEKIVEQLVSGDVSSK
ncbi:AAA family ATPase [Methanolobus sp. ZRKC2]|uniref:AAA family ATPase n=1 Tax=Methanolobus sp. ZRKC2 TaxID=3125783 RepID=UPI00324FDD41